ncbi:MAG TPA: ATP-binding protein [Mariprofundaceae bacterium]|nr:ATP-binding protein [Mariprofundaceae bacterium]
MTEQADVCEARISCNIDACSDCVHVLQSMAELMAVRAGMDPVRANRVAVAVDELFANIMRHGYAGERGRVEMEAVLGRGADGRRRLSFFFRDYAPGIGDPGRLEVKSRGEDELVKPGGLGLCLIHAVMDEVHHQALADGNRWHLVALI